MTPRHRARRGFTLVEVLISATLASMLMVAILSTFVFLGRNLSRLASYQALETEARTGLGYLRQDFALARAVKTGTTPTASTVTLVLPTGDVTYTYASKKLTRTATGAINPSFALLSSSQCECTSFSFQYYTTTDAAPTDQSTPASNVPYSIKQIQVGFVLESPSSLSASVRTRYEVASSRFLIRNRTAPDGT